MANYYGTGRSNYFKVKNAPLFLKWLEQFSNITVQPGKGKNEFCVFGGEESGDFPEEPEIFIIGLARFLSKHSVAILMSAGAEKLRYISGWALAVNSSGQTEEISLSDIYEKAKRLTKKPKAITTAEY